MIGPANRAGPYEDDHDRRALTYASLIAVLVRNAQLCDRLRQTNAWRELLVTSARASWPRPGMPSPHHPIGAKGVLRRRRRAPRRHASTPSWTHCGTRAWPNLDMPELPHRVWGALNGVGAKP
jgi:hypothetical protein